MEEEHKQDQEEQEPEEEEAEEEMPPELEHYTPSNLIGYDSDENHLEELDWSNKLTPTNFALNK